MDAPEVKSSAEGRPPKMVPVHARRLRPEDGVLTRTYGGRQDFPVLEAFRQFLEVERRRARQHLAMLTAIFALLLLAIGAVTAVFGIGIYRRMAADTELARASADASRADAAVLRDDAMHRLDGLTVRTEDVSSTLLATRDAQSAALSDHAMALEVLQRELTDMQRRNEDITQDLQAMRRVVPSLSTDLGLVVSLLEDLHEPVVGSVAAEVRAEALPAAVPAHDTLTMRVTLPGSEMSVPWRLPIAE
jgi:hypothetical protein